MKHPHFYFIVKSKEPEKPKEKTPDVEVCPIATSEDRFQTDTPRRINHMTRASLVTLLAFGALGVMGDYDRTNY